MKMANPHKVFGALAPVRPNDLPINLSAANRVFQCNTAQISDWAEASGLRGRRSTITRSKAQKLTKRHACPKGMIARESEVA